MKTSMDESRKQRQLRCNISVCVRVGVPVQLHASELTFTCFGALGPSVIELSVAGCSTFLEPCATLETATGFAALFLEAALGACG